MEKDTPMEVEQCRIEQCRIVTSSVWWGTRVRV